MNNILETAIKNKIAIEMIDYLGCDSIEDLPFNINYPTTYAQLIKDDPYVTSSHDANNILELNFNQEISIATMLVFEKYFDKDFVCRPFTTNQLQKALNVLQSDIWDVLEMKYILNM